MAQPGFIPQPFAENGDKNNIPNDSNTAASWAQGFPPITALPLGAGGIAPDRKDFNGIYNMLSAHAFYQQAGGVWSYSAAVDYTSPAIVYDPADGNLYFCVSANGPSTTAKVPSADATGQFWQVVPWGEITWLNDVIPTRTGNTTISLAGDQRSKYPIGKRLRFNGSDTYLCRVFGTPAYSGGVTAITVWFDVASTTIPASISKFERSRLTPQDTADGGLMIGSHDEATIQKLLDSYCCGSYAK